MFTAVNDNNDFGSLNFKLILFSGSTTESLSYLPIAKKRPPGKMLNKFQNLDTQRNS
jgi:hypothetical protein